jgi:hypothetical protein
MSEEALRIPGKLQPKGVPLDFSLRQTQSDRCAESLEAQFPVRGHGAAIHTLELDTHVLCRGNQHVEHCRCLHGSPGSNPLFRRHSERRTEGETEYHLPGLLEPLQHAHEVRWQVTSGELRPPQAEDNPFVSFLYQEFRTPGKPPWINTPLPIADHQREGISPTLEPERARCLQERQHRRKRNG